MELAKARALQKFGAELYSAVMPGCEDFVLHSDEYWECLCRHQTMTIYHYSGTAKMGPAEDEGTKAWAFQELYKKNSLNMQNFVFQGQWWTLSLECMESTV